MKFFVGIQGFALGLAFVFVGGVSAPKADALFIKKTLEKAKETAKKAKEGVKDGANKVKETVTGGAKKAGDTISGFVLHAKDKLAGVFSKETLNAIAEGIKAQINRAKAKLQGAFEGAWEKAKAYAKKLIASELAKKAIAAYKNVRAKVDPVFASFAELLKNSEAKAKLSAIFKKVVHLKIDADVRRDVKWLANKIAGIQMASIEGYVRSRREPTAACSPTVPFAKWPKSFGLTIGGSVDAFSPKLVGGMAEVRFGLVADLGKAADKDYDIRGYFHVAGGLGLGVPGAGAAANIMLSLNSLKTENACGGFFGIMGGGGAKFGGEIELEWGFADGTLVGEPSIGFAGGVTTPGGGVVINGGYAFTFVAGEFQYK